jgi:DNA-directed RNA polymerase specialized sigma24 family protein
MLQHAERTRFSRNIDTSRLVNAIFIASSLSTSIQTQEAPDAQTKTPVRRMTPGLEDRIMPRNDFHAEHEQLLASLEYPTYQNLLDMLRGCEPALAPCRSWKEIIGLIRNKDPDGLMHDAILAALLRQRSLDSERVGTILLIAFYPLFFGILRKRFSWDRDQDALWKATLGAGCEALMRINLDKRPERIRQKILNDTSHNLFDAYSQEWRISKRKIHGDGATRAANLVSSEHWDDALLELLDHRDAQQREVNRLSRLRFAEVISDTDFHILVGRRIYGREDAEQAEEMQVTVETAKKRRQRAEAKLRRSEHDGRDVP